MYLLFALKIRSMDSSDGWYIGYARNQAGLKFVKVWKCGDMDVVEFEPAADWC